MPTYLQIVNEIKNTALAQPNVNSVVREFLDLNREDAKYSAVVIQDRDGSRDRIVEQDYITYTWHLGYVDRLTYDESNRDDIISTGINIINNIVNTIRNTWFPELEVSVIDRINTFDQRFTAQCAGVYVVLAVNAQVSDCIDSESTDIYDKFEVEITENGAYHFVPSGRPYGDIDIVVNVENQYKPEDSLVETITSNGSYSYTPEEGRVFSDADITVDVHPTESLSRTYTSNGNYDITGEFNGGVVTVDVPERVIGFTEKEITEGIQIVNLSNSASYVSPNVFAKNRYIQTVNLPNCISIGENAFASCYNLSSIYLPNVETIGSSAFYGCKSLTSLDLPNIESIKNDAFAYCQGLTSITLNVKSITGFNYCSNLQEVSLPNVETIGSYAFSNCSKISSIYFPNCISIEQYAFNYCSSLSYVDLPKVKYIYGYDVFGYCNNLISVSMPLLIKISGYTTFEHCYSLSSLYLPKLRVIEGNWTFNDCKNLSIADIPALLSNGSSLFERDPKLKELYINSETYVIPSYMLSNTTTGITSIYTNINNVSKFMVASGWSSHSDKIIGVGDPSVFMLSYSDGVVNGMTKCIGYSYYSYLGMSINEARTNVVSVDLPNCDYIDKVTFQYYSNLTNVSLPNCEYIGSSAFYGCSSLSQMSLPLCEYISNGAFSNCISLTQVNLPMCSYIDGNAFYSCRSLSQISLPMCSHIGPQVFFNCYSLSQISLPVCEYIGTYAFYLYPATPLSLTLGYNGVCKTGGQLFDGNNISHISIFVPASLVDAYKSDNFWKRYSSIIFPIE